MSSQSFKTRSIDLEKILPGMEQIDLTAEPTEATDEGNPSMSLVSGVNHVAIVTSDLDRFVDFYSRVLGLELVFSEDAPAFRHAILRSGAQSWLHPVQLPGNAHGVAASTMFERGHLDHIALTAASPQSFEELRRRLVSCGACDGGVEDLGAFHALWFCDPDGMRVELALIVDPELRGFHAPVRRRDTGGEAGLSIERLTGDDARTLVEPLFREYVPWVFGKLASECGVRFDDPESVFESSLVMKTRSRG